MELPDYRVVFAVEAFASPRCVKPHTVMYYLKAEHCVWGLRLADTKIRMKLVHKDSREYDGAFNNSSQFSQVFSKEEWDNRKHWFKIECSGCDKLNATILSSENTWLCEECWT
jgi:hypothetical protein